MMQGIVDAPTLPLARLPVNSKANVVVAAAAGELRGGDRNTSKKKCTYAWMKSSECMIHCSI